MNTAIAQPAKLSEIATFQWLLTKSYPGSRVRTAGWCIAIAFGLAQALASRHTMQADGISYLDMGDAIIRGDWKMAINAYWSPLYPLLQGLAAWAIKPTPYWQFTVVHLVNFLIYLFALACFDILLRALATGGLADGACEASSCPFSRRALPAIGYALFIWFSLDLITLGEVSPDMLMAGFVYLATWLLVMIAKQRAKRFWFAVLLGLVLGLGYLAKAPMFPLALVYMGASLLLVGNWRRALPFVLFEIIVFGIIVTPWVTALSRSKGRLTFGDSGRINYLVNVNGASPSWYFQDVGTGGGHYLHTTRKIFDHPRIFEFATPIKGTQPVWYDASYWAEGAVPRIHLRTELLRVINYVKAYTHMLLSTQAALLIGFVVLYCVGRRKGVSTEIRACWPVWIPGLVGLAMYSLVVVEWRYVAVFFTLLWIGLFAGIRLPTESGPRNVARILTITIVFAIGAPMAFLAIRDSASALTETRHLQWQVAEELKRLSVRPGDKVARIGGNFAADWARLLQVMVVAEVPRSDAQEFWAAPPEVQAQIIRKFTSMGVTALVAQIAQDETFRPSGMWQALAGGTFYALPLRHSEGLSKSSEVILDHALF
ncbi:MAG: hypothetical protein JO266_23015 [Acidobacteria bacterium]|nr:hypothetical protein [Acidobacteriota bacterium]